MTAEKIFSNISNYVETGTPAQEREPRYTPGDSASPSSWSPLETVLSTPTISQNVTTTITPPSTLSPSWTMILSLWSILQNLVHFLTEQCGELIAELAVHLLFIIAMVYLGDYVDQVLIKVLGHQKPITMDDSIDEEAPHHSSFMGITKGTIQLLDTLADKIQVRIDNLEAAIVILVDGANQGVTNLCADLVRANKTIIDLEGELRDMTDARNKIRAQAELDLAASRQSVRESEAEQAKLSAMHDKAMKDSQKKFKEAGENLDRLEKSLSEAAKKIAHLETQLKGKDNDSGKPTSDEHTETGDDKKRILQLETQCKSLRLMLEEHEADTTAKIEKVRETAKANNDKAAQRRKEIADVQVNEIEKLKVALERKKEEFNLAQKQSADEITTLKEALAKKKEDDKPASSFNPTATVSTPSPEISSHSILPSSPHASIAATPLSPSPSDTPLPPSPSPCPPTPRQQPPIERKEDDKPASPFNPVATVFTPSPALAKKKEEDDERTASLNPAATVFMPPPAISNQSTLLSTPHASIPATPFFSSPSTTPVPPSPSPHPPTLYQQTPVKKEAMPELARRNLDKLNEELYKKKVQKMMGKSAEDEEVKPLPEEEVGKSM